ncbi:glycosyltransferase [Actinopolymorpha alba]|uniref:glycosyltransferase n=1 Tax=Actinopolymorpha alba TaxID=533267 RepID=UPI0003A0A60C|nr:glycosyltransferase [Actinopolymorpha alba]
MRVAVVSEHAHDTDLVDALADAGLEVTFHNPRHDGDALLAGLPEFGAELADAWRAVPPDVVHTLSWPAAIAGLLGRRGTGTPMVHSFEGLGPRPRPGSENREHWENTDHRIRLERAVCHDADHVVAHCEYAVEELRRLGTPRAKVTVVPYGVDTEAFRPEAGPVPAGDRARLLVVGPPVEWAGFDTAIAALRGIPDAELLLAEGPSPAVTDRLRTFAERLRVRDRVRFLGQVSEERLPDLLRSACLVVCAPSYDATGLVALQAAACGTPVIASDVGALRDTVIEGTTGVLVPPRNPAALARAVRDLLADPLHLEGFGVAAYERVRIRHRWSRIADETAQVYRTVTAA